jgi:hypothetical protein
MLVVTIEVWGGGNPRNKRHVSTMTIVNESGLADLSDYDVWCDGEQVGRVVGHRRADGAWTLVRRALRLKNAPR